MKKYAEFADYLINSAGGYLTTGTSRVLLPTLHFYPRLISIIYHYANLAISGRFNAKIWAQGSYEVFQLIEKCGGVFNITGLNNLKLSAQPVVFMANHMSSLENIILPVLLLPFTNYKLTFVVKKELLSYPIFNRIMKAICPIAVGREKPRDDLVVVLTEGYKKIRDGYSVVIYPQATRYPNLKKEQFNSLAGKLASRAKVPLVPIALKTDFWENSQLKLFKDFGRIRPKKEIYFSFGQPIEGQTDAFNKALSFIEKKFNQWTLTSA